MAQFCKDCAADMYGDQIENDFKGLCKEGEMVRVQCEGCQDNDGIIWVDHTGKRVYQKGEKRVNSMLRR